MSACPHGTEWLPPNWFSWSFIFFTCAVDRAVFQFLTVSSFCALLTFLPVFALFLLRLLPTRYLQLFVFFLLPLLLSSSSSSSFFFFFFGVLAANFVFEVQSLNEMCVSWCLRIMESLKVNLQLNDSKHVLLQGMCCICERTAVVCQWSRGTEMTKLQPRYLFIGVRMLVTVLQMDEVSCKNTLLKKVGYWKV